MASDDAAATGSSPETGGALMSTWASEVSLDVAALDDGADREPSGALDAAPAGTTVIRTTSVMPVAATASTARRRPAVHETQRRFTASAAAASTGAAALPSTRWSRRFTTGSGTRRASDAAQRDGRSAVGMAVESSGDTPTGIARHAEGDVSASAPSGSKRTATAAATSNSRE